MKTILIAASLLWIAAWISAQEVTGTSNVSSETTASSDPPTTTTTEPTTTTKQATVSSHNEYCFNGGTASCSCPPGFTGQRCESREQFTFLDMNLVFNNDLFSG
jgi:hypothetical protein